MPGPKGMDEKCCALLKCAQAALPGVVLLGLTTFFPYAHAETVNHAAKQHYQHGKSHHRICELTEADNIEIINRRLPRAEITRYDGEQAKLYTFFLQHGYRIDGRGSRLSGGYGVRLPDPDRLYIVDRTGHS